MEKCIWCGKETNEGLQVLVGEPDDYGMCETALICHECLETPNIEED